MTECCIKFEGPVSRETICQLVIEYLKYILYYRGQFPLPLDQLINSMRSSSHKTVSVDNNFIYVDNLDQNSQNHNSASQSSSKLTDATKQKYKETVNKFDTFFKQLHDLLISKDVTQVIMNLGPNMMSPKELHRIVLPEHCTNTQCMENSVPYHKCRLYFFKSIMHNVCFSDFKTDSLLPISILLLLKKGVPLTELMEQKRFYTAPKKCIQVTVRFDDCACDQVTDSTVVASDLNSSGLWVRLKTDLKGIKPCFE